MKWLRLLVLLLVLAGVASVALWRERLRAEAEEALRAFAEREVTALLDTPLRVGALRLSLLPPRVEIEAASLGAAGAVARVARATVEVRLRTSLRQRRPVLDVEVEDAALDLPALLAVLPPPDDDAADAGPPAFRLRRVVARDVAVTLSAPPDAVQIAVAEVTGQASVGASGRLRVAAEARAVHVDGAGRALVIDHAMARGGETAAGLQLTALAVDADGLTLSGTARDGALALDGTIALARLAVVDDALRPVQGAAQLSGTLRGSLEAPQLEVQVAVPDLSWDAQALGGLTATVDVDLEGVQIQAARLEGFGGTLEAEGRLTLDEALPFSAALRWQGLALERLAPLVDSELPALALAGALQVDGALAPRRVTASGEGQVQAAGAPVITWRGSGSEAEEAVQLELAARQGANRADVAVALAAAERLSGTVAVEVTELDGLRALAPVASLPDVRGALRASARLSGTMTAPEIAGEVRARDLAFKGARIAEAGGAFRADRHALHSDGIVLRAGEGRATLRGSVALDDRTANAWRVEVTQLDGTTLAALADAAGAPALPLAGGTLEATATGTGAWPAVQLAADATLRDVWLGRERIARATLAARAGGGRWTAEATISNREDQRLAWRAEGTAGGPLAIRGGGSWALTSLREGERAEMDGRLQIEVALRGPPAALDGTARVDVEDLVLGGRGIGTATLSARAVRGRWEVAAEAFGGALTLRGDVRPTSGLPFTVDGAWQQANLAPVISDQLAVRVESSGTLAARGRLADVTAAELTVVVTTLRLAEHQGTLANDGPIRLTCARGACTLAPATLRGSAGVLTAAGELQRDGRARLTLAGGGDLQVLELIGGPVQSATGRFTVDALFVHDAAGPRLSGALSLERAAVDVGLPVAITRTTGRLVFDGQVVRIEELGGRIGTGTFRITGSIDLAQGPALGWELVEVGFVPLRSLEMEVSGQGVLDGSWETVRLGGEVVVHRMLYDRDINLTDFLPDFNRALAAAPRQAGDREVRLDLHIRAPAQLFVENNLARIEGRADLRITGTAAAPVLAGRVEALDGVIMLRGREFELMGATVDFRPDLGLAAALNITAEALIDTRDASYTVGVRVTGTTRRPRVALTSDDPSLTQTDIATLIAVGRTTSQMRASGGAGFSAFDALALVPGELTSQVEGQATQILPIDRIEFDTVYSRTTGAFEPQIKIGKDLTDNLAVAIGQTFGVSSRTLVEADYRLSPRVSIPLMWESQTETEAGAFGGGVRVRYEFWRVTPFTLLGVWR